MPIRRIGNMALRIRKLLSTAVVAAVASAMADEQAFAVDEIQVYNAEIAEVGQWTIEQHLNYKGSGRAQPDLPGGLVPNHYLAEARAAREQAACGMSKFCLVPGPAAPGVGAVRRPSLLSGAKLMSLCGGAESPALRTSARSDEFPTDGGEPR